jgi:thiamine-phosphate pyrophosphorylase
VSTLPRPCVYLVTDRRRLAPSSRTLHDELTALERFLDEAIAAAVDVIQIRERDLDVRPLTGLAARVHARARGAGARVLVSDRADVAWAAGADGVHLRADSVPAARVRGLSAGWTIGRSVHERDEASSVTGADYLLFGTVFPSASKPAAWPVAGLDALASLTASVSLPVVAIGGVTAARVAALAAAGAAGVAGIGIFLPPPTGLGPAAAVRALRDAFEAAGRWWEH